MVLKTTIVVLIALVFKVPCQPPGFNFSSLFKRGVYIKGAVFLFNPNKNCSGTIIHAWWVLTAAQCVRGVEGDIWLFAGAERIGDRVLNGTREPPRHAQARLADRVHPHPKYQERGLSKYDIALVKVDKPFALNERVAAVRLSAAEWPSGHVRRCVSWGYGDVGPGEPRGSDVAIKSWNSTAAHTGHPGVCRCTERYQRRRLVCLRHADGAALCGGDAGASLLCPDGDGEPAVFGVAHMTAYKHVCGFERPPGPGCPRLPVDIDYMYTCPFNNWLRMRVPDVPEQPSSCDADAHAVSTAALLLVVLLCLIL